MRSHLFSYEASRQNYFKSIFNCAATIALSKAWIYYWNKGFLVKIMLYMVIEYFNAGAAVDIYRRARSQSSIATGPLSMLIVG